MGDFGTLGQTEVYGVACKRTDVRVLLIKRKNFRGHDQYGSL